MDHGSEVARPMTVESTNLGMAAAVQQGGEAHMSASTFHGQLCAAAARRASFEASVAAYHNSAEFARNVRAAAGRGEVPAAVFHREPARGVAYAGIGEFWQQPGPVGVVLVGLQLPGRVMPVYDNYYGYPALQPRRT
ncbi:unnamed protein product [Miscanthus lutarioriparius]|uniref:Uncharacterized protein n=1 Tax=Miscanthus lutarioriparius TaxID=422564 RepID=A0A811PSN0_9POAL|nr:unnamed protein product [Miscanthus lutarioriparius]